MQPDLDAVLELVRTRIERSTTSPRLVAVDGPSGSGKSTLARPLAARLSAPLIPIDDFVTWRDFGAW